MKESYIHAELGTNSIEWFRKGDEFIVLRRYNAGQQDFPSVWRLNDIQLAKNQVRTLRKALLREGFAPNP